MTSLVLQMPPMTLKKDIKKWLNYEAKFSIRIPGVGGVEQTEKFNVPRYDNEGWENFLMWRRELRSFFSEANLEQQPYHKFKYVKRSLCGDAKDEWTLSCQGKGRNDQDHYNQTIWDFTRKNLPKAPAKATKLYLNERAKLPENTRIQDWITRIRTINSMLPLMQVDSTRVDKLTSIEIREVIVKNLPARYVTKLSESGLDEKSTLSELQEKLMVYEANFEKLEKKNKEKNEKKNKSNHNNKNSSNKQGNDTNKKGTGTQFVNRCRKPGHGNHEWADCNENPANIRKKKAEEKKKEESLAIEAEKEREKKKKRREEKEEKHSMHRKGRSRRRSRKSRYYSSSSSSSSSSRYETFNIEEEVSSISSDETSKTQGSASDSESEMEATLSAELLISVPGKHGRHTFTALVDSGCSKSLADKVLAKTVSVKSTRKHKQKWVTKAGEFVTYGRATLDKLVLPQFTTNRKVSHEFHLFTKHKSDRYDFILGQDFTQKLGIDILNSSKKFAWGGIEIDMVEPGHWSGKHKHSNIRSFHRNQKLNEVKVILESKYEKADLTALVESLDHLSAAQQRDLLAALQMHELLFQGKVGKWKGPPIDIRLKPNTKPYHAKAYRVPQAYQKVFREEIQRLVDIGTLSPTFYSEWASPTFCIPKKDQRIRIVSDFRVLNSCIQRSPWPTPNIQEIFQDIGGFLYATAIDLNMGYYAMGLTNRSKQICTIILPWGKYHYNSLPMGVCIATDVFQQSLSEILAPVANVYVFIDDILIIGKGSWQEHLDQIDKVLKILYDFGMQVNPLKSFWAQSEVDYLGYIISRKGIKPQPKKVKAILEIQPPTTQRQLRRFIGMVNYYRDVWRGRSHYLNPLTLETGADGGFRQDQKA